MKSILIAVMLAISVVAVALPLALPAHAVVGLVQTNSGTCTFCNTISLAFSNSIQSGNAIVAMVCWSGRVADVSFSDSSLLNHYQQVVSVSNTVECAGAWTRAAVTSTSTVTVSWTGFAYAMLNIYEVIGTTTIINPYRTYGMGTGTDLSLPLTSTGAESVSIACYGTDSAVTLAPGASFSLDGTWGTGGCEHAVDLVHLNGLPMTASASVDWAGIGIVIQPVEGLSQCVGSTATTFSCMTDNSTNQVGVRDMLVVSASRTDVGGTWSISDNMSDIWTSVGSVSNTAKAQVWYTVAKDFGFDTVTVNFADISVAAVTLNIMDCGPECTNQSVTYTTGRGAGSFFSVPSQTMAIGPGFAAIATSSSPGTVTGGPGYYSWPSTASGDVESQFFASRSSNTCPASGTNIVSWAEICVSFRAGVVETVNLGSEPDTVPISPSNQFTVSYKLDGLSKTQSLMYGTTTWVDDQSDTNSISATTSGSTTNHHWVIRSLGGVAFPQTWPSGNAAESVTQSYSYYEQFRNTLEITPLSPPVWDGSRMIKIDGVQGGNYTHVVTFTPTNGLGAQTALIWTDKGQYIIWETSTGGTPGTAWVPNPVMSPVINSGGGTYNSNYTRLSTQSTTTTTIYSTTTATLSTTSTTTGTTTTTTTQTQTVTSPTTSTQTQTVTSPSTTTQTQTVTSPTTTTQTQTVTSATTHSQTTTVTSATTKTISSATTTQTQTVYSGTTRIQTQTVTSPTTTTQIQTSTSTATQTKTVTSPTTLTTKGGITATETQTVWNSTTTTQIQTQTVVNATTSIVTAVRTTTTTTTMTTESSPSYLWILIILPLIVFLLILYLLLRRERPKQQQ